MYIIFQYLVPYAQYGRSFDENGFTTEQKIARSLELLEHPDQTREIYEAVNQETGYFDSPQGFWDRLQFVSVDDGLIQVTDQGKVFGLLPLEAETLNAIPHIFWPNKPVFNFGNIYAHEVGALSDDDTTTGISFSPTAEAYHMARWAGVLVVAPLIWFIFFLVYDSLFGDLRNTPWGLLILAQLSHEAPEGALTGVITLLTFGIEIMLFCVVFATYVAPVFATLVLGPERKIQAPQFPLKQEPLPGAPQ